MPTWTAEPQSTTPEPTARRSEWYRLRCDSARPAAFCAQMAGASRFVYNRKQRRASKARENARKSGKPMSHRGRRVCGQPRKLQRRKKRRRENANHRASRKLANAVHTVVSEALDVADMTKSARGTVEEPGTNVKQKAGLNREILNMDWGQLERNLAYRAGRVVKVDPAYTSQTCSFCGHLHPDKRRTRANFKCLACGFKANAAHNAALNILARGFCAARCVRFLPIALRNRQTGIDDPRTRHTAATGQGLGPPGVHRYVSP